jgi:hypothetical protein
VDLRSLAAVVVIRTLAVAVEVILPPVEAVAADIIADLALTLRPVRVLPARAVLFFQPSDFSR